jgi:NEDD8-activating enzyme E1 regulatory subunit
VRFIVSRKLQYYGANWLRRLWAATGQSALESARVLVLSASATSTSILKNLVLPGVGHFSIIDHRTVSPEDAGNNFFLDGYDSVGKSRSHEAVRLLLELNDSVDGNANIADIADVIGTDAAFITSFSLVIAHNLHPTLLDKISSLLWSDHAHPPLVVVRSAGFLAEFYIQYHEHDGKRLSAVPNA